MANTNLVGGTWATNGAPLVPGAGSIPFNGGNYWYLCNRTGANGSDGNEGTADMPFATLAFAISKCVADQGDVIVILSGHAESVIAAAGIAVNIAGITIIGEGNGADRPRFTFSTSTAATMTITAANVTMANIVGVTGIDVLVSPFVISGDSCTFGLPGAPMEWQDPSSSFQAIRTVLTTAAADKLTINLRTIGITSGGTAPVNAVRLVGCNAGIVTLDFYGRASTAVVEFVTTASVDVEVYGYMYNSGTTNYTKDVVDTVTGSTWFASFNDGAAGFAISGGSGSALGPASAATVIADLTVASADSTANALMADVVGNKTDAAVTAVGTTKSIEAYVKGLVTMNTVIAADSTNNAFAGSVVGNKTDASVYVAGTTNSNTAYAKGTADLQERFATSATAVLANGTTIFTIAGGPIIITSLISECVVGGDSQAATVQYAITATGLSQQTISAASGSVANAAAHATVSLIGTALSTAAVYSSTGVNLGMSPPGGVMSPVGLIKTVIASGPTTTGTWRHIIRYRPLVTGVTVS